MTLETDLYTVLHTLCPRVFTDVAPFDTPRPYVIYQQIGGQAYQYLESASPGLLNAYMQISVWDDSRLGANALMRQIEVALVAGMQTKPQSALQAVHDEGTGRYGAQQDFDIWAART